MFRGSPKVGREVWEPTPALHSLSELLLLLEEHREANDRSIDQETTANRHDHGREADFSAVGQDGGEC
jgi:hypothetical protein